MIITKPPAVTIFRKASNLPVLHRWSPDVRARFPIDSTKIAGFKQWLNVIPFSPYAPNFHTGFTLMAYEAESVELKLGLPPETPVQAILDGIVFMITDRGEIVIMHSRHQACDIQNWEGHLVKKQPILDPTYPVLFAGYSHFNPVSELEIGSIVEKGDVIGRLRKAYSQLFDYDYYFCIDLTIGWGSFNAESGHPAGQIVKDEQYCDPTPVLFPGNPPPLAQYDHYRDPRLMQVDKPVPNVWPSEREILERLTKAGGAE